MQLETIKTTTVNNSKLCLQSAALNWKFITGFDSKVECTGDIDGDGRDEVLVSIGQETQPWACISVVSYLQASDLDDGWGDEQSPLFTVQWSSPAGIPNWTYPTGALPRSLDNFTYLMADIDGDNLKEIIAFFPGIGSSPASIGVLKWANNQLNCLWQSSAGLVPGNGGASLNLLPGLQMLEAQNIDGQGKALVVLQPGTATSIAILRWNGTTLYAVWSAETSLPGVSGIGSWSLADSNQIAIGDLDSDGMDEIVLYTPGYVNTNLVPGANLGIAKWNGAGLDLIYNVAAATSAPEYVTNVYQVFVADFGKTGTTKIAITTGDFNLYLLEWQQNQLNPISSCIGTVPGTDGATDLMLYFGGLSFFYQSVPGQQFYVADLDGNGPAFFVVSVSLESGTIGAIIQFTKGGFYCTFSNEATNWGLSNNNIIFPVHVKGNAQQLFAFAPTDSVGLLELSSGQLNCSYKSQNIVPGWNLNFIVNLPATPFTDFVGAQLELYQQISLAITPPAYGSDENTGDIRHQYTNTTDASVFSGWASQIKDMPPIKGFSQDDWDAVAPVISAECGWVSLAYGLKDNMATLASVIKAQQDIDLSHCYDNIKVTPLNTDTPIPYWTGAIIDAGIWALAALPFGPLVQAGLALGASLFGSWANAPVSSAPPVNNVPYNDFQSTVDQIYLQAINGSFLTLSAILTDPIKLRVVGPLLEIAWAWNINSSTFSTNPITTNLNRIMFYQMMMNADFSLFTWFNYDYNYPSYMWKDYQGNCEISPVNQVPNWAYATYENPDGSYNMWMIAQGSMSVDDDGITNGLTIAGFPEQSLMQDLFNNLQVPQIDLLNRLYGWDKLTNYNILAPDCSQFRKR